MVHNRCNKTSRLVMEMSIKHSLYTSTPSSSVSAVLVTVPCTAVRYGCCYLAGGRCSPRCSHPVGGAPQAQPSSLCSCTWQKCTDSPAPNTERGNTFRRAYIKYCVHSYASSLTAVNHTTHFILTFQYLLYYIY